MPSSSQDRTPITSGYAFAAVLILGLPVAILTATLCGMGMMIWSAITYHRNLAAELPGILTARIVLYPLFATFLVIGHHVGSLLVVAIAAALAAGRYGCVPGWVYVAILPTCYLAALAQVIAPPHMFDAVDPEFDNPLWAHCRSALAACVLLLPSLLMCWLWLRRGHRSSLKTVAT